MTQAVCQHQGCACPSRHTADCCEVPGATKRVTIQCNYTTSNLTQNILASCLCEPCISRVVAVEGSVYSSALKLPISLAAVMVDDKIVALSDPDGKFEFSIKTIKLSLKMYILEANHRMGEVEVRPGHQEVLVMLEKIGKGVAIRHMEKKFSITMISTNILNVIFSVPEHAMIHSDSLHLYRGSGMLFYSVYTADSFTSISTRALNNMVYVDSRGVSFNIEAILYGSLTATAYQGFPLSINYGAEVMLKVNLTSRVEFFSADNLQKLHIFICSPDVRNSSCWRDLGQIKVLQVEGKRATILAILRMFVEFWAIGLPTRSECFVKVAGVETGTQIHRAGMSVVLRQSSYFEGMRTFTQKIDTTSVDGTCLQTSCSGGGTITVHSAEATNISITHGLSWNSDMTQVNFYISTFSDAKKKVLSPYYRDRDACERTKFTHKTAFLFVLQPPPEVPPDFAFSTPNVPVTHCFIKVAVDDCLPSTDVQTISTNSNNWQTMSIFTAVAIDPDKVERSDGCYGDVVTKTRSSCVEYSCKHFVRITVRNRPKSDTPKLCQFVGSSLTFPSMPQKSTKEYLFMDRGHYSSQRTSNGIYSSTSRHLAQMSCLAGDTSKPSLKMDHTHGYALMFTCQF